MGNRQRLGTAVCGITFACLATAHVRLIYGVNGNELFWSSPQSIGIAFNKTGSADVSDGSDLIALRNAVATWNNVDGTTAQLIEDLSEATQLRTDFDSDDVHLMMFDEDGSSGWFPSGTGTVAVTPISFFTSGEIIDADVLFNGRDYAFTTSGQSGRFDIQDVAAHELGHLLGLDHSGVVGATLYPYVDPSVILGRSVSVDDIHGLQAMYPAGSKATITGSVLRGDSSPVVGAHVVARDIDGRTVGAALSDGAGAFTLRSLEPGSYRLWADPLDQPVSIANLSSGHTVQTDFESTELGVVVVPSGGSESLGSATVGGDASISLGRVADDYPLRVIAGQTVTLTVRGSGLVAGSSLTAADTTFSVVPTVFGGNYIQFQVSVPSNAGPGHVDLLVSHATGGQDLLPGALEITPPDPVVSNVSPASGDAGGGYSLTLTGSNFRNGSRVVIADRVYVDGQAQGCNVVDATTITLTLAETAAGVHDVVVIDPSGIEGRALSAFGATGVPTVATLFPLAGTIQGGTELLLTGTNFMEGASVTIDGVLQTSALVVSAELIEVTTQPGPAGGPYVLTVHNPDGSTVSSAFSYVNQADPRLEGVFPTTGTEQGGDTVTLLGTGFSASTRVRFGAHPETGAGGVPAASVEYVDANTLRVVTPASSSNLNTVLVADPSTEQASLSPGAFTFLGTTTTKLDSGACYAVQPSGPLDHKDAVQALWWVILLVGASAVHRRTS